MKQFFKKYAHWFYMLFAVGVLVALVLSSGDPRETLRSLRCLEFRWVLASVALLIVYLAARAAALRFYLCRQGCPIGRYQALLITGIGQFYSAITPSSTGGQPMQVLHLHQRGVPVSVATAALSVKFVCFQVAFVAVGALCWLCHLPLVSRQLGSVQWLVLLGFVINMTAIGLILLMMVNERLVFCIARGAFRFLAKMKWIKDAQKNEEKAESALKAYRESLLTLAAKPFDACVMLLLAFVQVLAFLNIAVCVYRAFGLLGAQWGELLTLSSLLFITAGFVPLPGAAGAQEGGFYLFFRTIFPEQDIMAAIVAWRFFTYYTLLLSGMAAVVLDSLSLQARRKKKEAGEKP